MTTLKQTAALNREALVSDRRAAKRIAVADETDAEIKAYTVPAFVKAYGISRAQVFIELREGRLKARKYGNRNLILAEDAKEWAEALPLNISHLLAGRLPYLSGEDIAARVADLNRKIGGPWQTQEASDGDEE